MNRCVSCMSVLRNGNELCSHCGYDNSMSKPVDTRHLKPGTILKKRFQLGLSVKSNRLFITYIAYDLDKKKVIYIDEFMPENITKRVGRQKKVAVRDEYKAEFVKARKLITRQTKTILEAKLKGLDILGSFGENNTCYIIRERCKAPTLVQYIKHHRNISMDFAKNVTFSLIDILEPVHELKLVSGNIAPENIIVKKDGSIVLTSFGFGTLSNILPMPVNKGYSPLEAYEHGSKLTPKADIYSIAAVFYSIITAERPLSSKRRSQVDTLVPPSKRGIKIDRSFENALLNALNIKAENRTESLRIFNEELCSEKTKRKWERVKAPQKRDLTFVKEGFFWRKVAAYAMVIVMAASLIGIIIETSIVKNKEQQEYENRPEVTSIEAATVSETENTDF